MKLNWINAEQYNMETFLLFDRWMLRCIFTAQMKYEGGGAGYVADLAKAFSRYPYVLDFCSRKAPECRGIISHIREKAMLNYSDEEVRQAETAVLQTLEVFVVYAYPEIMNNLNYIRNWNEKNLFALVELEEKVVLDVGSGTGRLAFAAAKRAKRVYASEPASCLREYMRDRIRRENIQNMKVVDGEVQNLPFEDDTFDVILAGHVVGDYFDAEIAELSRVGKNGGWIVCCNGEDEFRRKGPSKKFITGGFEYFFHKSREGGTIYDYRKKIVK